MHFLPRLLRRGAAAFAAFAAWLHSFTVKPLGEWLSVPALGAIEESVKSVVRGWFASGVRFVNEWAAVVLSVFSRQNYGRRRRRAAAQRGQAWQSWWADARGTFNALIEQEGLFGDTAAHEADDVTTAPQQQQQQQQPLEEPAGKRRRFWAWPQGAGPQRSARAAATAAAQLDLTRGRVLFAPAPAGSAVSEVVQRRGLVEDVRVQAEVAISKTFAALRRAVRLAFFLDRAPAVGTPRGAGIVRRSSFSVGRGRAALVRGSVFTTSDAVLRAGYPLEEHTVTTSDGYVLQMQRIPRRDARDVVFFQHGVLDTSLGWVASGAAASAAFAAHDAGYDCWLANTRANPPRLNVDPARHGARYWNYSANELALCDITAQINHIHARKVAELGRAGAAGRGAGGPPGAAAAHWSRRASSFELSTSLPTGSEAGARTEAEGGGGRCAAWPPGLSVAVDRSMPLRRAHSTPSASATAPCASPRGSDASSADGFDLDDLRPVDEEWGLQQGGALGGSAASSSEGGSSACSVTWHSAEEAGAGADAAQVHGWSPRQEALPYCLQAVGHSLGAACLLMYAVVCRMRGEPHRLQRLVLLSPAGFHPRVPLVVRPCQYLIPTLTAAVDRLWPGRGVGLRLPGFFLRWVTFKLVADLRHVPALRDLVAAFLRLATSGDSSAWHEAMSLPHYSPLSMPAASLHLANHFAQWAADGSFRLYDYGSKAANRARYGAAAPPSVAEHYGLLGDLPVDLVAGTEDGLIAPENVQVHLAWLRRAGVRCSLREEAFGHLGHTFGVSDEAVRYVLARLRLTATALP